VRAGTALDGISACAVLSAAGLYASEAAGPLHTAVLLGAALYQRWRWTGRGGAPAARRRAWEAAAFAILVAFLADLFVVTRNLIGAALRLLAFIVAYHADNPQTPRGARQTLALTFIQMIAAAASTTEVSFSLLMLAYLAAALYTLAALGAAEREEPASPLRAGAPAASLRLPLARLTSGAAPAVAGLGLAVFFCVPHYGTGYFREQGRGLRRNLTGFSDRIELGSISGIKKSHATVMRVRAGGPGAAGARPALPLRMRGIALDRYDGRVWSVSDPRRSWLRPDAEGVYHLAAEGAPEAGPRDRRASRRRLTLEVLLEPLEARVLFTPPDTLNVALTRFHGVAVDAGGSVFVGGASSRRLPYRTVSSLGRGARASLPGDEPPEGAAKYLQLPPLDPRIPALARDLTAGVAGAAERARAVERHLRETYAYSLDVNDAEVASPLTHFLVERRPGHCEYFAASMAVLLRVSGIPARVVNGFYGGEHSELSGQTIVRQSDAHSWVEAWLPGAGWTTFDPTPAAAGGGGMWAAAGWLRRLLEETEIAWDTYIVGLDLEDQRNILEEVRDQVDLALAAAVIRLREALRRLERLLGGPGRGAVLALAGAALLAAAAALAAAARGLLRALRGRRRRTAGAHKATAIFLRFERACARTGLRREPHVPASAFARSAGAPEVGSAFDAARYGPASDQPGAVERLRREVRAAEGRLRRAG
jgi:transglutaminase-like putative cysteine protease